jgi:hypothetical protein
MAATGAPPDVRREIDEQVTRMNHLVTDILDYSKAWSVEKRPVVLADLLAQPGVEVQGSAAVVVEVDRRAMLRVLGNLVDNARAAGSDVALFAEAGPPVTLDVCDNGAGVPPEIAGSLFRPFVSRRPSGTGLGLAIVARLIMEAHGGSVVLAKGAEDGRAEQGQCRQRCRRCSRQAYQHQPYERPPRPEVHRHEAMPQDAVDECNRVERQREDRPGISVDPQGRECETAQCEQPDPAGHEYSAGLAALRPLLRAPDLREPQVPGD